MGVLMAAPTHEKPDEDAAVRAQIAKVRKAHDLSQAALAERAGLSQGVIAQLEKGPMRVRVDHLKAIAGGLAVPPAELFPPSFLGDKPRAAYQTAEEAERYHPPAQEQDRPSNRHDLAAEAIRYSPDKSAWTMKSVDLMAQGVLPGDTLIVDSQEKPQPGDIVCAQIYSRTNGRTVFRLYQPPYLMTASVAGGPANVDTITADRIRIVGPVVQIIRERRPH